MRINNEKDLAAMIHGQRAQLSQSQKEIAELVGLRQATVSAFESDPSGSRIATLFKLLSALELEMELKPKHKTGTQTATEW
jgi:HTH-type transcriptional regulator/antitoxin HipB